MSRQLRIALLMLAVNTAALDLVGLPPHRLLAQSGVLFESNWDTVDGTSKDAVTDGGRWPNYWEFNQRGVTLMSVVSGGINGHNALRVQQRGDSFAANLQVDNFIGQSRDYYLRYYFKNDDTSSAGDHIATVDTFQYANLTFLRKFGGPARWRPVISLYGCGFTYPIGHWNAERELDNGKWYRFEYFVHYVTANRVQVHPRVYDETGTLILNNHNFRQQDVGSAVWSGRSDWSLALYYDRGQTFCVDPSYTNDFGLGNNGQFGARDTGQSWYFSAVQIRNDGWPGPVDGSLAPFPKPGISPPDPPRTLPPPPELPVVLKHPGDVGIANDPDVVFAESFDQPTIGALVGRWTDFKGDRFMSFSDDAPEGSPVRRSLAISWPGDGGVNTGGHLFQVLSPGLDETAYVRYYIKYPATGSYRHVGVWMGGANPPVAWPDPHAGSRPVGNDRFSAAAEQSSDVPRFDHYNYWMNMRPSTAGPYWGNTLLNARDIVIPPDQWTCVEHMVTLNRPVTASNGEHAIWINERKVSHVGPGFPLGFWSGGSFFPDASGGPFEGLQWRSDPALSVSWIWLMVYAPDDRSREMHSVNFAHLVVAKRPIGCLIQ